MFFMMPTILVVIDPFITKTRKQRKEERRQKRLGTAGSSSEGSVTEGEIKA